MKSRLLVTVALMFAFGAAPASAATMSVTLSKTTSIANEEKVNVTITNFPTKAGIYLQQCVEPVGGARPAACNRATQLWVTSQPGGSFKPGDAISMTLVTAFDGNDCTTKKCGVFARLDHTAGTDTSEDLFIPVTFSAAGAAVPTTTAATPAAAQTLTKFPKKAKVGTKVALPLQTDKGVAVTYRTASPKICTVSKNVVKTVKTGSCKLQAYAPAGEGVAMYAQNLTLAIAKR